MQTPKCLVSESASYCHRQEVHWTNICLLAAVKRQRLRIKVSSPAPQSSTAAAMPTGGGLPVAAEVESTADQGIAPPSKKRAIPISASEPAAKRRAAGRSATTEERALPISAAEDSFAVGSQEIPEQPDFQLQPLPPLNFRATAPLPGGQRPLGQPSKQGTVAYQHKLTPEEVAHIYLPQAEDSSDSLLLEEDDVSSPEYSSPEYNPFSD